jgi:hypothetical protein
MSQQFNNTTFNRSNNSGNSSGYYSRTLFSFTHPDPDTVQNLAGGWYSNSEFDGIADLIGNYGGYCHGSYTFPGKYWFTGKTLRVKGSCMVYSTSAEEGYKVFNMRFGLKEFDGDSVITLAVQNNNNNHIFISTSPKSLGLLPVEFQCDIKCTFLNPGADPSSVFQAQGYYIYDYIDYDGGGKGTNSKNCYIPVYLSNNNGFIETGNDAFYRYGSGIIFNFYANDGTVVDEIYITNLTIEELA